MGTTFNVNSCDAVLAEIQTHPTSPNDERMYYVLHYSFDYDPPFYLILTDYDGLDSRIRWVNATLWTIIHTSGFAHIFRNSIFEGIGKDKK